MRQLFTCLLIVLLSFGFMVNEVSAKRFGGGRSFGVQRSKSSLFSSSYQQRAKPWGQRTMNTKRWGGILGGLLVGGLLASLFMGHGLGTGLLSWLILGSVVYFLFSVFRRKMQPQMHSAEPNGYGTNSATNFYRSSGGDSNFSSYPVGFSPEVFLRDAKGKFIRLQTAYDQKNITDLQEFTAPEVFAEIKMQLDERGQEPNRTEVLNLEAELLDVSKQVDSYIASVRFTGSIKENDSISQLNEIWHFRQFYNNGPWVVGGIQQEIYEP